MAGDRIENSAYVITALEDVKCKTVCDAQSYKKEEMEKFRQFVAEEYRAQWMVDGLPAAFKKERLLDRKTGVEVDIFSEGFPIGKIVRSAEEAKKPITKVT